MKTIRLFLILMLTGYQISAQPFSIGSTTITFTDPSRSNRAIETDIYYPASAAGNNVPVATGQFPVIAFGHGFVMTVAAYQNIWTSLVPQGYIVALPKTEGSLSPSHTNFARDLAFVVNALQQAGTMGGSLFNGKISATSAVMGHSMGGGAAMLSVQYNASITAVAGLAPAETNPSASAAAQLVTIPALILAGGNDCVTPAAQHSRLIYDNIGSGCKWYLSINGGSHCQFANQNFNCSFGEATCSSSPAIPRATQQAIAMEYLLPWLNFELKGSCSSWINKQSTLAADNRLTPVSSCTLTSLCPPPSGRKVSNIKSTSVQFNWSSSLCAASYELRYRKTGTTSWIRKLTSSTSRIVYNLTPGSTYEWQVRAVCDSAAPVNSNWGTLRNFSTAALRAGESGFTSAVPVLSVYPNPGNGRFRAEGEGFDESAMQLSVLNMMGQTVYTGQFSGTDGTFSEIIDVSILPPGVYLLQATSTAATAVCRIIIQ
ncbi:MAG: T9SS type A sorting domain-containing protein [Bacteroidia bacterium]